jgi:carnitine O-acetyltransferase
MSKPRSVQTSAPRRSELPPGYVADPNAGPMLRYEASLPRLPVPTLASTGAKYLETVKPHLSQAQFSKTQGIVSDFLKSSHAAELQKRLEARAADPSIRNWLSDWWNDAAYMGYRDSVVVNVSYFYVHTEDKRIKTGAKRAATLIKAMLPYRELVENQQLEPDKVKGAPLSMESSKWL